MHPSSDALRKELEAPSRLTADEFREAAKAFRPVIHRVSEQASKLQQLLVDVEIDETDPIIQGKLVSLRQTLGSLQRQHDRAEKAYAVLSNTYRMFLAESKDVAGVIEKAEAGDV